MTEDQLKEIEARAKAATQGDWQAIPLEPRSDCLSIYGDDIVCRLWWLREEDHTTRTDDNCEANAAHIAGMSPSATFALVEEVRRLREALAVNEVGVDRAREMLAHAGISVDPVLMSSAIELYLEAVVRNALGEAGRG
jgi:hypothetical protein